MSEVVGSEVDSGVMVKGVPSGPFTVHCQDGVVGGDEPQTMVPSTARVAVSPGTRLSKLAEDQGRGTMFTVQAEEASGGVPAGPPTSAPASALVTLPPEATTVPPVGGTPVPDELRVLVPAGIPPAPVVVPP